MSMFTAENWANYFSTEAATAKLEKDGEKIQEANKRDKKPTLKKLEAEEAARGRSEKPESSSSASAKPRGRSKSADKKAVPPSSSSSSNERGAARAKSPGTSSGSSAKASSSVAKASVPDDKKKQRPRAEFVAKMGPLIGTFARNFVECKSIDEMSAILKTSLGLYRPSLAPSADPECAAAAIEARKNPMPNGKLANVASYKSASQRSNEHFSDKAKALARTIGKTANGYTKLKGVDGWSRESLPFGLIMKDDLIEGKTYKILNRNKQEVTAKKLSREPFWFTSVLDCGDCWLCGQKVYSYSNEHTNTACGECEHVGAITASFFAGMLAIQGNENMKVGYGVSDVNCNQRKWDFLSVKFNIKQDFLWNTDRNGAIAIAKRILDSGLHGQSYCPEYARWFEDVTKTEKIKNATIDSMVRRILEHSQLWCDAANAHLREKGKAKSTGTPNEKQAAAGITRILQESIDKISGMSGGTRVDDTPMIDPNVEEVYDPYKKIKIMSPEKVFEEKFVVVGPDQMPVAGVEGHVSGEVTPGDSQEEYIPSKIKSEPPAKITERLEQAIYEKDVFKYEPYSEEYYVNDDDSSQFFKALREALIHVDYPDDFDLDEDANVLLSRLKAEYDTEDSDVKRMIDNLNEVFNPAASTSYGEDDKMYFSDDDDLGGGSVKRRKTNKKYKYPKKRRNTKRKNHKKKKSRA